MARSGQGCGPGRNAGADRRETQRRGQRDLKSKDAQAGLARLSAGSENRPSPQDFATFHRAPRRRDGRRSRTRPASRSISTADLKPFPTFASECAAKVWRHESHARQRAHRCSPVLLRSPKRPRAAEAQSYPSRPIKMVVPFPCRAVRPSTSAPGFSGSTCRVRSDRRSSSKPRGRRRQSGSTSGRERRIPMATACCAENISTLVVLPAVTNNRDYDPSKVFSPVAKILAELRGARRSSRIVSEIGPRARGPRQGGSRQAQLTARLGHGNATHLAAELFQAEDRRRYRARPL